MPNLAESALDVAGIGAWEFDVATGRAIWSATMFRLHDLPPGDTPPPDAGLSFYPPAARQAVQAATRAALESGAPWDLDLPLTTAAGRQIRVRARGRAMRVDGRTTKLFGAVEDTTAHHELATREARLALVARQIDSIVMTLDRDGRMEWVNDAFTRVTGYTLDDVRGRMPGDVLNGPQTDPQTARHIVDCLRDGIGFEVEVEDRTKDGRTLWMAVACAPIRDAAGTTTGFISVETDVTAQRDAEAKARREAAERERAEALLRDVLDAIPNAVSAYDADDRFILANRAYIDMFPVSAEVSVPGQPYADILRHAIAQGKYPAAGRTVAEQEAWIEVQLSHHRNPPAPRTLQMANGRAVLAWECRSGSGNLVSVRTDTTDLVRAEELLRDILEALPSAVMAYDRDERLLLWNQAAVRMLPAVAPHAVPGMSLTDLLRLSAEHGQYCNVGDTPEAREQWVARQLAAYRAHGPARTLYLPDGRTMQARESRSESGNLVCVRTDTTDLKRAEDDLRIQAERDPLTMLANRSAFLAALDRALADAAADQPDAGGTLLLLDVDYFKQINDSLGHDMGDALLVEIAARLRGLLRTGDMAARLGGDEFAVTIPGLADAKLAAPRIEAIHTALSAPVELAGRRTPIGISLGATLFPRDGTDAAKLLKNADLALYEAKRNGRGRWAAFRPEQAVAAERQVHMADALRRALAQNQFTIALQPQRLLRGGGHAGFEALARWHDGTRWVPPAEFVPVAEDTGLIGALGRIVMETALARIREIRDAGFDPGRVAVNVTGPQLLDSHFKAETLEMLRRHGLRPADLELELTETILLGRAAERIDAVLREFSRLGMTLALDDFGTGYASLAHLSRLPIDRLKIDRSFVQDIAGPGGVIARTVVSLAHSLDMEVVAEGVETAEQVAFLEAAGCDTAQGYLYSRPLATTAHAIAYLRGGNRPAKPPKRLVAKIAHG